jgi:SAM-dependent methyltransferase
MSWADQSAANRDCWSRRCDKHAKEWYRLDDFEAGGVTLDDLQLSEVGDVAGKSLLHLQCNVGLDTLSWARKGAIVTGMDISGPVIEAARRRASQFGIPARFVCCDVYDLKTALAGQFDVVYTSQGVLCWLNDLNRWAETIAFFLKPSGFLYIMEEHPFSAVLDDNEPCLSRKYPYFHSDEPDHDEYDTYQWSWSLSDVVNALIRAGLRIEFLHERPFTFYQRFGYMKTNDGRWWHIPGCSWPLMFTLRAAK